ncbi:MAG TPA: Ig-like domain-containing protein, partial [Ignavibacteriales bacterium]|nr:Ig-like domain-containing protein [Ignavibacteriales bacterium]
TYSFVNVNSSAADSSARYRDYYYNSTYIIFTSPDSGKLTGLVGDVRLYAGKLATTLTGYVVDANGQAASNAKVYLNDPYNGSSYYKQTRSDANGKYVFTHVDNGTSVNIKALSEDGSLEGYVQNIYTGCGEDVNLRPQVSIERIVLNPIDNVSPFVSEITPVNGADVNPAGLNIVIKFSEPIKQTPYTQTSIGPSGSETMMNDLIFSYEGLKKAAGEVQVSASWNADFTQLTITPAEVAGAARYAVNISTILPKFTDLSGRFCIDNQMLTGDYENLNFSTNGGSPVPAAPALIRRTGAAYDKINCAGGIVGLEWNEDGNAAYYNVYRKRGSGPYELIAEKTTARYMDVSSGVLYAGTSDDPQKSISASFKVTPLSADLVEGAASNIVTVTDEVKPSALAVFPTNTTGFNYKVTVSFSEYMNMASAQTAANYSFTNLGAGVTYTITNVEYKESESYAMAVVSFTASGYIQLDSHLTVTNLKDLAGNVIDPAQLF